MSLVKGTSVRVCHVIPQYIVPDISSCSRSSVEQYILPHASDCRFPVVAKPSACAGSFAVLKAHDMTELSEAVSSYYSSLPAYLDSVGLGPTSDCATGGMVVEELVVGKEVSLRIASKVTDVYIFPCIACSQMQACDSQYDPSTRWMQTTSLFRNCIYCPWVVTQSQLPQPISKVL